MRIRLLKLVLGILLGLLWLTVVLGWKLPAAHARPAPQFLDPVLQGEYLAVVAGCHGCHTPLLADGSLDAQKLFAGGQAFSIADLGTVYAPNLTPDQTTGLGNWTDEEIKKAIATGQVPAGGRQLLSVMPYEVYNGLSASDLDALVAYLRSLPPITNPITRPALPPVAALPQLPYQPRPETPGTGDNAGRGQYLVTAVLVCTQCHTPYNAQTGRLATDKYLAGGQPFNGPWGTVYAGNLTPNKETGLGNWTAQDLDLLLTRGVRPDGRYTWAMPWNTTAVLLPVDREAVIYYLRNNVPAVRNAVPSPQFNAGYEQYVPKPEAAGPDPFVLIIIGVGGMVITLVVAAWWWLRQKPLRAKVPPQG